MGSQKLDIILFIATECALSSIEAAATVSPLFHFLVPLKRKTTLLLFLYTTTQDDYTFFSFFLSFQVPTLSIRLRNVVPYFFLVLSATSHVCSNADKYVLWCIPSFSKDTKSRFQKCSYFFYKTCQTSYIFITRFICNTTISERQLQYI